MGPPRGGDRYNVADGGSPGHGLRFVACERRRAKKILLLAEVDNRQPFTLGPGSPTFLETYDAGTLYIYVKEDLWLKMALEQDERKNSTTGTGS
jgi:hypothetical protein